MKRLFAVILVYAFCNFALPVDPLAVRALERDLAGQSQTPQPPAKGNRNSGLALALAGIGMAGTGVWLMATSREAAVRHVPGPSGAWATPYENIPYERYHVGRAFTGTALIGAGSALAWQGFRMVFD